MSSGHQISWTDMSRYVTTVRRRSSRYFALPCTYIRDSPCPNRSRTPVIEPASKDECIHKGKKIRPRAGVAGIPLQPRRTKSNFIPCQPLRQPTSRRAVLSMVCISESTLFLWSVTEFVDITTQSYAAYIDRASHYNNYGTDLQTGEWGIHSRRRHRYLSPSQYLRSIQTVNQEHPGSLWLISEWTI